MMSRRGTINLISAYLLVSTLHSQLVSTSDWDNSDRASREPKERILDDVDGDLSDAEFDSNPEDSYNYGLEPRRAECEGYTCQFRKLCGSAPLNPFSKPRPTEKPYIVDGEKRLKGEWPSFVRLEVYFGSVKEYSGCGGVLISDKHVLTAAHCIYKTTKVWASNVVMFIGGFALGGPLGERKFEASTLCIGDNYKVSVDRVSRISHDWAILTLDGKIKFNNFIEPACLPYQFNSTSNFRYCHLVGWSEHGEKSRKTVTINKMPVRQVPCSEQEYESDLIACYVHAKTGSGGTHSIDSGGPILCLDATIKRWTVVGTLSEGDPKRGPDLYVNTGASLPDIISSCGV